MVIWITMVIRMVSRMGGGTPYDYHMVKINHMVKIWKISSKNPNHHLLNLHLQLLNQIFARPPTPGFARRRSPGRRRFSPTGLPAGAFKDGP